jgi:hypothetical protein
MYAPRRWALKKRPLFIFGKVFRAALSLVGLFGLLRSWRNRRERCPEDGLDWTIATRIKSYVC